LPGDDVTTFKYFIGAGISYAVGYSIQELFTLCHLIRTRAGFSPNWLGRLLYRLFDRRPAPFQLVDSAEYEQAKQWLYSNGVPQRFRDDHERIESLKHVGTTLGPCFLVGGGVFLWKDAHAKIVEYQSARWIGLVVVGFFLILLGWLKVTQQAQYLIARFRAHHNL
jgi:hypothetical protein